MFHFYSLFFKGFQLSLKYKEMIELNAKGGRRVEKFIEQLMRKEIPNLNLPIFKVNPDSVHLKK